MMRSSTIVILGALATACPRYEGQQPTADVVTRQGLLPTFEELIHDWPACLLKATTTVKLELMGNQVVISDEKRLLRLESGDFDLSVRRAHKGSEIGDTDESLRAILVGRDYYTRGSGGPFVRWDDAQDEPREAAQAAWRDTAALVGLAARCATVQRSDNAIALTSTGASCYVETNTTSPQANIEVKKVSGELKEVDGRLATIKLSFSMLVTVSERQGNALIEHQAELTLPPQGSQVVPPGDYIESRRARPVKMIESVLSGLVETWGPGAPRSIVERSQQGVDDVGGRH